MRPEETVDFRIRAAWQAIYRMYNHIAATYDSTMAVGSALLNIDQENGTPSTQLGPKMGMEPTSLSRLLRKMDDLGLIRRQPHPIDGRSVLIFLTEFGKEKRLNARDAVYAFNTAVRDQISEVDMRTFFNVLDKIGQVVLEQDPLVKK